RRLFGVQSAGEEIERHSATVLAQSDRIAQAGERMIIGDKVERFAFVLQGDRRPHHAKVIANMQNADRLNAGKNAHGVARDFSTSLEMTSQWLQSLLPCFCAELIGQRSRLPWQTGMPALQRRYHVKNPSIFLVGPYRLFGGSF